MIQVGEDRQIEIVGAQTLEALIDAGVTARLFGGVAINLVSPWEPIFKCPRPQKDIDVIIRSNDVDTALDVLGNNGWKMNLRSLMFNEGRHVRAKHSSGLHLDLFTDPLHLNQTIHIDSRFKLSKITLTASDLLLTKLQAAKPTERDLRDILALVLTCRLSESEKPDLLNVKRLCDVFARSWGFYYGACLNIERIGNLLQKNPALVNGSGTLATGRLDALIEVARNSRKTVFWTLRSVIGPRFKWFDDI